MARAGRPMKYDHFLNILEPDQVYTPATIVQAGAKAGFFHNTRDDEITLAKLRIRHTLARFSQNHGFPEEGDGYIVMPGQAPIRGWFGWRWRAPLENK